MQEHTATLVDGTFPAVAARELLLALLDYKINYHLLRKFSNEERFGADPENSNRRLAALAEEKQQLIGWFSRLHGHTSITVTGTLKLRINE